MESSAVPKSKDATADLRREPILNAALAVFARYGFKRASMEDIAREAGVSRPSVYLHFANKAAVFRELAHALAARAEMAVRAAWPDDGVGLEEGLPAAMLAQHADVFALVKQSPHGRELLSEDSALVAEVAANMDAAFTAFVSRKLQLAGVSEPAATAQMLTAALHGLKDHSASLAQFDARARLLASLLIPRGR